MEIKRRKRMRTKAWVRKGEKSDGRLIKESEFGMSASSEL